MNIEMITKETEMTVLLDGRLDTTTAPELEQKLAQGLDSVAAITLDFTKLRYISSAGLRSYSVLIRQSVSWERRQQRLH